MRKATVREMPHRHREQQAARSITKTLGGRWHGNYGTARCPAHSDRRPSLSITERDEKVLVYCHTGCNQQAVWDVLRDRGLLPEREGGHSPRRVASAPPPRDPETGVKAAFAKRIWADSRPAPGTPVQRYLESRDLTIKPPPTLRYHPRLKHRPTGLYLPAMVAAVTRWPSQEVVGVHRTFIKANGSGKAPVAQQKMMLGACAGGAVRLTAATDQLVLAEGIETALSVWQATGISTWACLSTSGLKAVILPSEVRMVFIAADGDQRGEDAAVKAADRCVAEGRRTKIARPPWGMDFNDLLGSESLATLATLAGGGRDI